MQITVIPLNFGSNLSHFGRHAHRLGTMRIAESASKPMKTNNRAALQYVALYLALLEVGPSQETSHRVGFHLGLPSIKYVTYPLDCAREICNIS